MPLPLSIVEKGQGPSADDRNRISDATRNLAPRASGGKLMARSYPGGVIITPLQREQPPSWLNRPVSPFDITVSDDGFGGLLATFRPGTINSLLPSNYLTGVAVPASGTKYLVLTCTASSGQITAAAFSADASAPAGLAPMAGEPPTSFKILIGICVDGVPIKVWGNGNIQAIGAESFRVQKGAPVAGQVPYDVYYTWSFSLL